ncbi:MAG: hypothetical protein JSV24_06550 [Bacteroidales bacterium]|nr:MAG: hypothetical protein JSV24_06550 [Bacteroidales bacterium]
MKKYFILKYTLVPITLLVLLSERPFVCAQNRESPASADTLMQKEHSPRKAWIFSAAVPGLGQVYNKKYWKVPVIYAGFGVLTYFVIFNTTHYNDFKYGLLDFTDTIKSTDSYLKLIGKNLDPTTFDPVLYPDSYDPTTASWFEEQLEKNMSYYRRNRDLSYIGIGLWYILNIIDATVDAYLFDYDIGDDLTLHIEPGLGHSRYPPETIGIKLTFQF